MKHDRRVLLLTLGAGLPALFAAILLLWMGGYDPQVRWSVTVVLLVCWLGFAFAAQERVVRPLQTLSNMIAALRERDFSMRARGASVEDALGLALLETNLLGDTLRAERLGAVEATALLGRVMAEIDVAIFAFDERGIVRLVNRGGERLLRQPAQKLIGDRAEKLGLGALLEGESARVVDLTIAGRLARWEVRRTTFRQGGRPQQLVMLADLSKALRDEERQAWQRLIRVLSHEINNSLAPIKSIAGSLQSLLARNGDAPGKEEDLRAGLAVIANRSASLSRFMAAYARLARLPQPTMHALSVEGWVRRVVGLETRGQITIVAGPDLTISADGDQLDQLLINLVSNAVDASAETRGAVEVGWKSSGAELEVWVKDDGPGMRETANLFVPFFTTKPEGSGIGLVLSRQIAEAHGGSLALENRADTHGCVARLHLPIFFKLVDPQL